jgi:NADPH2:quinone reductase
VTEVGAGFELDRGAGVDHPGMLNGFGDERKAAMRAIQVTSLDGPGAVEVAEVDEPDAGDQVVIAVHAAGVAFPDALLTRGLYQYKPDLPFTPGAEIAGVVRSAPAGSGLSPGDRVAGLTMLSGGMAEVVALPPDRVFPLPESVSFEAGAGLLFNDLTVHFALRTRGRLAPGETVLVHGAAGGIGTSTLRLARAFGAARTIAVVSSDDKVAVARAAGASDVVLADGFKDAVKELTGGRGVDLVVDPVGGDRVTDSLRSLTTGGRLLVIGFTGGDIPTVKVNRLLLNNVDVVGVGWGAWTFTHPGYVREQWAELEPLLASGQVSAPQPQTFPMDRAADAIAALENRSARGKVVITIR